MIDFIGKIDKEIKVEFENIFNLIQTKFSLPKNIKVNVNFVNEAEIQQLNKTTRNIDKVTDVLTYPYIDLKVGQTLNIKDYVFDIDPSNNLLTIGDIYICVARAEQQANEFGHSFKREICFLFCHGMLHILGYDHIKKDEEQQMIEMQNTILNELNITRDIKFKCGFVTIVGETNVGKSTLINKLVGQHVSIVSPKTQTTRENILGIYNDNDSQIVFIDTPGYHKRANKVDDEMEKQIQVAGEDTEIVLMLISAKKPLIEQYEKIIAKINNDAKKILVINKIDETNFEKMYPQLAKISAVAKVDEIIPISALKGKNCDVLIELVKKYLPTFNYEMRYFPQDEYTDKNMRHIVAEIIREKALLCLDDEVPHGVQVMVTEYKESEDMVEIFADMYCERESHKAIILGKNGAKIKEISTLARQSIEKIISQKVNLQVFVKVKPNWCNDENAISMFGLKTEN